MQRKYRVCSTEELRQLCIKENWFTNGNCGQYEKMFEMNREMKPLEEIALVIWICSKDIPREEIEVKLESKQEDYLMMLAEEQQAEGERIADEMYCAQFD